MTDVLIRDVAPADLDQIRAAATDRGTSVQNYLRAAVHAQAVHLRREAALTAASERLHGRTQVTEDDRSAVLDSVDRAHDERADRLGRRLSS